MILQIWSQGPPYEMHGRFWDIVVKESVLPAFGVGTMPKPYQQPHPPIAISAMSPGSFMVRSAASRGWHAVSANFVPTYCIESHWKVFLEGCAQAGLPPDGDKWHVARTIVVADSDAAARDYILDPAGSTHAYFSYLAALMKAGKFAHIMKPDPAMSDDELTPEVAIKDMVIAGSPKSVVEQLLAFRERVGPFGTLVISAMDWQGKSREIERRSMELLAREVMPALTRSVGEKAAAE